MSGGAGRDHFVFDTALGAGNVDTITDFSPISDTIDLDRSIFTAIGNTGTLAAGAFQSGAVALQADDRILYDGATGRVFYDADGNGAGGAVQFAQLVAGLSLTNADFFIVA